MHSGTLERTDSPKKRLLSRGMSEEESLRHIIQEVEQTPRRLSCSGSRHGSLKRGETRDSQSQEEQHALTNMTDLQASYEDCVQELQALELKQEVVLFQVDCLQDALLGAEEMLAETQREAHEVRMELEREREQRSKLEKLVDSLRQEMDWLKEEKDSVLADLAKLREVKSGEVVETDTTAHRAASVSTVNPNADSQSPSTTAGSAQGSPEGLASLFKSMRVNPSSSKYVHPPGTPEGTSVDEDVCGLEPRSEDRGGPETGGDQEFQDGEDNDENSGYEDARSEFPPGTATPGGPLDSSFKDYLDSLQESELNDSTEPRSPRGQDSCCLS